jgi:alpha-L-fucosidase
LLVKHAHLRNTAYLPHNTTPHFQPSTFNSEATLAATLWRGFPLSIINYQLPSIRTSGYASAPFFTLSFAKRSALKKILPIFLFIFNQASAQPLPSKAQLQWQQQQYYLFMHFGPNTFTGKEWGEGDEKESLFNPTALDCNQWCRIAKAAGAKGIIITAKHHDGFCLWPSRFSTHTVKQSPWKNGKGDVLKELSQACKKYGLSFGVYLSPWDRNHPDYGTGRYNQVFAGMMQEIFAQYGPVTELWWDGANGEGPNGKKQVYDWELFKKTVKRLSPNTLVFSDVGPHIRWVGNERGLAGTTNWNYLDTAGFAPGLGAPATEILNSGNPNAQAWIPAECDVSIRPGWFYRPSEDSLVKTPAQLFQIYLQSIGRGANLLLNVPPNQQGRIHSVDSAALMGFARLRQQSFARNLFKGAGHYHLYRGILKKEPAVCDGNPATVATFTETEMESVGVEWKDEKNINCIVLREDLRKGQQCARFKLLLFDKNEKLVQQLNGTTIGQQRILTFPAMNVATIELTVLEQKGPTRIAEIAAYKMDAALATGQ